MKSQTMDTFNVIQILEYDNFFPGKPFDVDTTLRRYSREKLFRIIGVLGFSYAEPRLVDPRHTFFSSVSEKHIPEINKRLERYREHAEDKNPIYCTPRTILELLRHIYAIPVSEYKDEIKEEDIEYNLFKIILKLNQTVMSFYSKDDANNDWLIFLLKYVSNDFNNLSIEDVYTRQFFYFFKFKSYLEEKTNTDSLAAFLKDLGIQSFDEYYLTILAVLYTWYTNLKKGHQSGYITFNPEKIKDGTKYLAVLKRLSIDYDEEIPFDIDSRQQDNNTDYRSFRSRPLIKMPDGSYVVYNIIILLERLYTGLYFDFKQIVNQSGVKSNDTQWFNKEFIEHRLFQRTMLKTLPNRKLFHYPSRNEIVSDSPLDEDKHAPDFYLRTEQATFLFECKSVKLNGRLKDKADADELVRNIRLKLFRSDENIDPERKKKKKSENVGITQIVEHLKMIDNEHFKWDDHLPDPYYFYPVLVLDDYKLSQCGMSHLLNSWYNQCIKENGLQDEAIMPLIVMSIETLYFYSGTFKKVGYKKVFDRFFRETEFIFDQGTKEWTNPLTADFDQWMARNYTRTNSMALFEESKRMIKNISPK